MKIKNYDTFCLHSKAEIIINEGAIDDVFKSIYTTVLTNIQKKLGKGSCWIIDSFIENNVNTSKHNLLSESSYAKLPKEMNA